MREKSSSGKLRKALGLFETTFYGIGIILGAGIYALIGLGAGIAGNALWLSFGFAAIIALCTALSYAELSSMYPKDAAEYVYTQKAFGKPAFSFIIEWIMLFTLIVSTATVALGFGGYFSALTGLGVLAAAIISIGALSVINYLGIKESSNFNIISTLIEMSGLVIVIIIGAVLFRPIDLLKTPSGPGGILSATAIIFFAFIGFEQLANFSEETKDARRVMPRAPILSVAISTILYMLVSVAAVIAVGSDKLAASEAPLTEVVKAVNPGLAVIMTVIALFATANTVLAMLITGSRLIYGLSLNKQLPQFLSRVGSRGTPHLAIIAVMALAMLSLFLGGIKETALLTDIGVFLVYIAINLSVLVLRVRNPAAQRRFRSPFSVGNLPLPALIGLAVCFFMLFSFSISIALLQAGIIAIGLAVYGFLRQKRAIS